MKYPNDIVNDDGWGRIHKGHGLSRYKLYCDLKENTGIPGPGQTLKVKEVYFRLVPRVKWCANYGWPCDNEGEWHSHWEEVRPNPECAFTVVHWSRETS